MLALATRLPYLAIMLRVSEFVPRFLPSRSCHAPEFVELRDDDNNLGAHLLALPGRGARVVVPHGPVRSTPVGCRPAAAAPLLPAQQLLSSRVAPRSAAAPVMGLFGLGAPELAIIGGVALMILGPDQLKKLAKDVGKVSAELKQVSTRSSPSQ